MKRPLELHRSGIRTHVRITVGHNVSTASSLVQRVEAFAVGEWRNGGLFALNGGVKLVFNSTLSGWEVEMLRLGCGFRLGGVGHHGAAFGDFAVGNWTTNNWVFYLIKENVI